MDWIEHSAASPAENLALDEALLDFCEESQAAGFLRFWESPVHFVVVGYSNKIEMEVNSRACEEHGIPILRRCSGGGTVLQGPGCYNYTLCLPIQDRAEFETITSTNRFIMEQNRAAIARVTGLPVKVQGHTDLAIDNLKFSGNAQRRKRHSLLFHGSFLLDMDLEMVSRLLRFPSHQPDYRAGRSHTEFIRNIPLTRDQVRDALVRAWNARPVATLPVEVQKACSELLREKYLSRKWNYRW